MSALDGFQEFNFNEGVPYVSITNNGIAFNKSVVMKLDYPEFVKLLINHQTHQIAIQKCEEDVSNATKFYKPKKSKIISVRWNGKDLINTIQDMMGWELENESYRVDGELLKDDNAMIFNLNAAAKMK